MSRTHVKTSITWTFLHLHKRISVNEGSGLAHYSQAKHKDKVLRVQGAKRHRVALKTIKFRSSMARVRADFCSTIKLYKLLFPLSVGTNFWNRPGVAWLKIGALSSKLFHFLRHWTLSCTWLRTHQEQPGGTHWKCDIACSLPAFQFQLILNLGCHSQNTWATPSAGCNASGTRRKILSVA